MKLTLKFWKQESPNATGNIETIETPDIPEEASFLEMLDIVNEDLLNKKQRPIAFDHDCREGICGMCSLTINGIPHGPESAITVCQLHMRHFNEGETIWIEPFRAQPFPILQDLVVDRTALDRIVGAGGFISVRTGAAVDANSLPIPHPYSEASFEAAACIGCGACVAACPNASAMLFVGAKAAHLNYLPQGLPEKDKRVLGMVKQMDKEGFGNCTNHYECEAVCPKTISVDVIAKLNRDYTIASVREALV